MDLVPFTDLLRNASVVKRLLRNQITEHNMRVCHSASGLPSSLHRDLQQWTAPTIRQTDKICGSKQCFVMMWDGAELDSA